MNSETLNDVNLQPMSQRELQELLEVIIKTRPKNSFLADILFEEIIRGDENTALSRHHHSSTDDVQQNDFVIAMTITITATNATAADARLQTEQRRQQDKDKFERMYQRYYEKHPN